MASLGFRSIRWTLQLWHAGLLAVVLAGFGLFTFVGTQRARYEEVDATLTRDAQLLTTGLRPSRPSLEELNRRFHNGGDRPPDEGSPFGPQGFEHEPTIEVSDALAQRFGDSDGGASYFAIWHRDGTFIRSSKPSGAIPDPGPPAKQTAPGIEPPRLRQRGDLREAYVYGPFGVRVLVGRSTQPQRAATRRFAWLLVGGGTALLVVGLVGGWLLSERVLRPIQAMTMAAQEISASNLSRRIDVAGTQSELETLATVLNSAFARLEAAFVLQVRFTADASHELRTPLAVIHTNAQLALSRERSAPEYRKSLETCLRASARMKGLVDSLLLLARVDAGRLSLERAPLDLDVIVRDSVAMVQPLAAERGITLSSDLSPIHLSADGTRLGQVAVNLLTNAVRYNRDGGSVGVTLQVEGDDAVLRVADTGVGISAEHHAHVFERFFRVDPARAREAGGAGLGLAICKSIVESHGGTITFTSEPGVGTTFTVRVPIRSRARGAAE